MEASQKLIRAWPIVKWLDDARWSIGASGSLIPGDIFASLAPSGQILTHSGKYCFGKTPWQTFLDSKYLAGEKMLDRFQPTDNSDVREVSIVR